MLFVLCLIPFWVSRTGAHARLDDPAARVRRRPGVLRMLGLADAPVELLYHDGAGSSASSIRAAVHGGAARRTRSRASTTRWSRPATTSAAARWTVLRRIVIPHAMPGIVAGSIVVFMLTVGNFPTPVLLGGKNALWFTEQIYTQFITRFNWEQGAAFGFLLLLLSSAIVWAGLSLSRPAPRQTLRQA